MAVVMTHWWGRSVGCVRLEGRTDRPATVARQSHRRRVLRTGGGQVCTARNVRCRCQDKFAHPWLGVRWSEFPC
jgi:hypothetical protein